MNSEIKLKSQIVTIRWQMIKLRLENIEMTPNLHKQLSENLLKHNYQTYQTITLVCNHFS